ncbi:MAG: potassium transporter KefC [Methylococcales bacterium]|nr:potassium transporter KefC [Methylococcales bacterium]
MSAYLADIIILLIAAVIAVPLFKIIKLDAVPAFIIAGIVVGPSGLALIYNITEISHLAEIGVVFLLFVIGIELKPSRLWRMKKLVFGLGLLQVILTSIILSVAMYFLLDLPLRTIILVGPALALSSTAFVLQILTEQKALTSTYGRASFAILLLQDLAVVPLLALVSLLAMPNLSIGEDIIYALLESVVILLLIILSGRYFLHKILHQIAVADNSEIFTATALLIVLGISFITEQIGLSMAMGAFLAGLLISDSPYRHQIMAEIHPFRGLLLGLFFMSMGMAFNLQLLIEKPLVTFTFVVALLGLKFLILTALVFRFGFNKSNSLAVGLMLAQSGEFALVLFALAFNSNIISEQVFQQLLLVVILSMLTTPILAHYAQRILRKPAVTVTNNIPNKPIEAPIVIAGFGRVGHRIGEILTMVNKPFVALDLDPAVVENERKNNQPVFYGDVCKPELLKSVGAANAKLMIISLNNIETTQTLVSTLRKTYPKMIIYVRGHNIEQCKKLRNLGASGVVSDNIEASIELPHLAMQTAGIDDYKNNRVLTEFRDKYHAKLNEK